MNSERKALIQRQDQGRGRNIKGPRRITLLLLLGVLFAGCARQKPHLMSHAVALFDPEERLRAITALAPWPAGMQAKGTVRLTFHGKTQPRIKGMLAWIRTEEGILLRATGIHLIGGTIFDLLVTRTDLYLYIPAHKAVYREDLTNGEGLAALRSEALLIASPWGIALEPDATAHACAIPDRPRQVLCVDAAKEEEKEASAAFDPDNLSPLCLALPHMTVHYGETKAVTGLPYPTSVRVELARFDLTVEIQLKEIETKVPEPGDPIFDPEAFQGLPHYPISVLLEAARDAEIKKADHFRPAFMALQTDILATWCFSWSSRRRNVIRGEKIPR